MYVKRGVAFVKGKKQVGFVQTVIPEQDALVVLLADSGVRGLVRVPHEAEECGDVLRRYGRFVKERDAHIRQLVELRTADQDMQDKIIDALRPMLANM
jgi:hypothetical protein